MGLNNSRAVRYLRRHIGRCAASISEWACNEQCGTGKTTLAPLTPAFDFDQHQTYVDHLNACLEDENIRNIALTGRYGAGKSSVLQEFARQKQKRVLFLSISTLGPDDVGESRTNQIEKELVKQLLHREKPARLPQSRYQRIDRMSKVRAVAESVLGLLAAALSLWVFGVFPKLPGLSSDHYWWIRCGAGFTVGMVAVCLLAWVRLAVHNRLELSAAVSAGGASISLAKKSESYFDQYLDEIVYFFESMRQVDIVVFEDLDRFDEPGIFEALRELNALLNNSKQTGSKVIRFVYALRDSIFEKLGHDTLRENADAASAEAVRANRTKFFDLVVPIVPFITHRTSRDLLTQILNGENFAPVVPVAPELVDLIARHLPDMRLLTNIRNEYMVYSKRLITDKRGIEPLEAAKLFALVVYKNVHLADFELVLLGRSNLDSLYRLSRELVSESIATRQARLRKIVDAVALHEEIAEKTAAWGEQLNWFFFRVAALNNTQFHSVQYVVGGINFDQDAIRTEVFWRQVFKDNNSVNVQFQRPHYNSFNFTATVDDINRLLGNHQGLDEWITKERDELAREEGRLLADLEILRIADFKDLAKHPEFTLNRDGGPTSFSALLAEQIESEVSRALVTEGFIDRYYTLYVAQYYGDRVPVNSMNFIVQNVDTNRPDITYSFNDDAEIAAILRETNRSFLSARSARNIGILDYLLKRGDAGAQTLLDALVTHVGDEEQAFLQSYLADGKQATTAVEYLASRWSAVFTQVVETVDLPRAKRLKLVDVALANSDCDVDYELDETVRKFLQDNWKILPTLAKFPSDTGADLGREGDTDTILPTDDEVRNAITTLVRAGFVSDDLAALNPRAIRLVVEQDAYTMTAANLRAALGEPPTLSLDRIRGIDADVYVDALAHQDEYLRAITKEIDADSNSTDGAFGLQVDDRSDSNTANLSRTRWTVEDPFTFADIVTDLANYSKDQVFAIISRAAPDCMIDDVTSVPSTTWAALALSKRFPATLENVDLYINHLGKLDADLAVLLIAAGRVTIPASGETTSTDDSVAEDQVSNVKIRVAEAILNASTAIADPTIRVQLVSSLKLDVYLPVDGVKPETGHLLGLLIEEGICDDEPSLFEHFATGDWETLRYAIDRSLKFAEFVTPGILGANMTSKLFESGAINAEMKRAVLKRFDEFVPAGDIDALSAAGRAALETRTVLSVAHISAIASSTRDADLVVQLLDQPESAIAPDQVLAALVLLPAPYAGLATSGAKLIFPRNDHHTAVLKRLQEKSLINTRAYARSLRGDARIEVTVN